MYKPKKCLRCESNRVLIIRYGLPNFNEWNDEKDYPGGCVVEEMVNKNGKSKCVDPKWHCRDCDWEWGNKVGRYNKEGWLDDK